MDNQSWGLQKEDLALDDVFKLDGANHLHGFQENEAIIIGQNFGFPLDIAYEKLFIGGKTGSGKSYTAGTMMEEMSRHGIQFVCFDALDAHSGLKNLPNVECIEPRQDETVNLVKLVYNLKHSTNSLVVNLINLRLDTQQRLIGDYCETLLAEDFEGKPIMTFLEECQDFVPQMGKPYSFAPIVRLTKLGRGKGLGAALISQRPAAIHKEALSQVSTYMVHNVINTKDLEALKNQLSFGTDKETIKKILSGISYAGPGEMVCFSPKYFKDVGYIKVGKVDRPRKTEHGGKNIEVTSQLSSETSISPMMPSQIQMSDTTDSHSFSEITVNPMHSFEEHQSRVQSLQSMRAEDNLMESNSDYDMEWEPDYPEIEDLDLEEGDEISEGIPSPIKAVAAISLFSTGIYMITRGLAKSSRQS